MTCCIAALCENGKSIVLVSDKMIGTNMIQAEPDIRKVITFHKDWKVMIAGNDIGPAFPIVDFARSALSGHKNGVDVEDVMAAVYAGYIKERKRIAESIHLLPIGWSVKKLNSVAASIIPESRRVQLWDKLEAEQLDVSLLVAGFDKSKKGHIFSLQEWESRGEPMRHDIPGFFSIGSGSEAADYLMMYRSVGIATPLRLMVYYAFEAKTFGERASGVGTKTDVFVLRPGKVAKIKEASLENKLAKLCDDLKPKDLEKGHLDVLNEMRLTHAGEISKLLIKKENGKSIITDSSPTPRAKTEKG